MDQSNYSTNSIQQFDPPQLTLRRVIGCSVTVGQHLAENPVQPLIAYTAGPAQVVIFNYERRMQEQAVLIDPEMVSISCLGWSKCGRYLVSGGKVSENAANFKLIIWDQRKNKMLAVHLIDDKSIHSVTFSAAGDHILLAGKSSLCIMNWRLSRTDCVVLFTVRDPKQICVGITSNSDGNRAVIFGRRLLISVSYEREKPQILKVADIGDQQLVSVAFGRGDSSGKLFALTTSGRLLVFTEDELHLESWIELPPNELHFSVTATDRYIALASSQSVCRLFDARKYKFLCKLPLQKQQQADRPDCSLVRFLTHAAEDLQLLIGYADRSFAIFDLFSTTSLKPECKFKCSTSSPHTAPVDSIKVVSDSSMVTVSFDGTMRLWDFHALSSERSWIFNLAAFKEPSKRNLYRQLCFVNETNLAIFAEISGKLVAIDLRNGKIVDEFAVHQGEIICHDIFYATSNKMLIGTGGRDKGIAIVEASIVLKDDRQAIEFNLMQISSAHKSTVTGVCFSLRESRLHLFSSGIDAQLLLHELVYEPRIQFELINKLTLPAHIYSMAIDPAHQYLACVGNDFKLYAVQASNLQSLCSYPLISDLPAGDKGHIFSRIRFDPSGIYVAAYAADLAFVKSAFRILQFFTGTTLAVVPAGQSNLVRSIEWTKDFSEIITAESHGNISIWGIEDRYAMKEMRRRRRALVETGLNINDRFSVIDAAVNDYVPGWVKEEVQPAGNGKSIIREGNTSKWGAVYQFYEENGGDSMDRDAGVEVAISALQAEPPSPQAERIDSDFSFSVFSPSEQQKIPFEGLPTVEIPTVSIRDNEMQTSPCFNPIESNPRIMATSQTSPINPAPYIEALKLEQNGGSLGSKSSKDSPARQLRRALANDKVNIKRQEIDLEQTFRIAGGLLEKLMQQSTDGNGMAQEFLSRIRQKISSTLTE